MYFDNFLTNMKYVLTRFEYNNQLLTEAQNIRLLFQKVHNLRMNQVMNLLQASYNL